MKSDNTVWAPLAMALNSIPSKSMSSGWHHSTIFPARNRIWKKLKEACSDLIGFFQSYCNFGTIRIVIFFWTSFWNFTGAIRGASRCRIRLGRPSGPAALDGFSSNNSFSTPGVVTMIGCVSMVGYAYIQLPVWAYNKPPFLKLIKSLYVSLQSQFTYFCKSNINQTLPTAVYDMWSKDCNFHRNQTFGIRIDHLFVYFWTSKFVPLDS